MACLGAARCQEVEGDHSHAMDCATQTKEDPAEAGRRLAEEFLPKLSTA